MMNDHRTWRFYFDSITMIMARSHEWAGEHIHFRGRYISFSSRWFRVALKVVNFKSRKDSPPLWSGQTWSPLCFPKKKFLLLAVFFSLVFHGCLSVVHTSLFYISFKYAHKYTEQGLVHSIATVRLIHVFIIVNEPKCGKAIVRVG